MSGRRGGADIRSRDGGAWPPLSPIGRIDRVAGQAAGARVGT